MSPNRTTQAYFCNLHKNSMKRFELILLLLSFVTVAFAYAGFADRYGDMFVSMNTLGVIIAITHIAGYIATRRGKNRRLVAYKRKVIRSAIRIADNKRMAYIGGWLLTSFVWGIYVSWFLLPFWFFSLYPLLAIWIWYYKVVQNAKRLQNKIIGFKPLTKMMFVGTLQCVGILIYLFYLIVCEMFTFLYSVCRPDDYSIHQGAQLYSGLSGIVYLCSYLIWIAFLFVIPFVVLIIKNYRRKRKSL